jgi:hypothetical protein
MNVEGGAYPGTCLGSFLNLLHNTFWLQYSKAQLHYMSVKSGFCILHRNLLGWTIQKFLGYSANRFWFVLMQLQGCPFTCMRDKKFSLAGVNHFHIDLGSNSSYLCHQMACEGCDSAPEKWRFNQVYMGYREISSSSIYRSPEINHWILGFFSSSIRPWLATQISWMSFKIEETQSWWVATVEVATLWKF